MDKYFKLLLAALGMAMAANAVAVPAIASPVAVSAEKTVVMGELSVRHSWRGPPRCKPRSGGKSGRFVAEAGWAILSVARSDRSSNKGRAAVSVAPGGEALATSNDVVDQFDILLYLAKVTKNQAALKEITAVRDAWLAARVGVGPHNAANFSVWAKAHGNCFDRKRGWQHSVFTARVRFVGTLRQLADEVKRLKQKFFAV